MLLSILDIMLVYVINDRGTVPIWQKETARPCGIGNEIYRMLIFRRAAGKLLPKNKVF